MKASAKEPRGTSQYALVKYTGMSGRADGESLVEVDVGTEQTVVGRVHTLGEELAENVELSVAGTNDPSVGVIVIHGQAARRRTDEESTSAPTGKGPTSKLAPVGRCRSCEDSPLRVDSPVESSGCPSSKPCPCRVVVSHAREPRPYRSPWSRSRRGAGCRVVREAGDAETGRRSSGGSCRTSKRMIDSVVPAAATK